MHTILPAGVTRFLVRSLLVLASVPAAAQSLPAGCDPGELATVPLTLRDGELPIVEARINGQPVPAQIDTGAQQATHLDRQTLERFGIKVLTSETTYANVQVQNAHLDRFALGPVEVTRSWFNVDDLKDAGVGARIGANLLFRTDVEIALAGRYLKFFKPSGCLRAPLAYWDPKAHALPFRVHSLRKDLRPWFKVRINGKEIDAVISTINELSYIDLHTARRMGLSPEAPGARDEGTVKSWYDREQRVWRIAVPQMSIGSLQVNDFSLRLLDMGVSGEMLVLGVDFLKRHRVYVAMSQNRIYFTPVDTEPASPPPTAGARVALQ